MIPKLPREFLWRNFSTMDELLGEYPGEQLYHILLTIDRGGEMSYSRRHPLKVLNEVFYISTRMVYEKDSETSLKAYIQEIKADMGSAGSTKMVLTLTMYLLKLQSDQSDAVQRMIAEVKDYFRDPRQYYLDFDFNFEDSVLNSIVPNKDFQGIFLTPTPCPAKELYGLAIDWREITQGFSKKSINEILWIWPDQDERATVMSMIEHAFRYRDIGMFDEIPSDMVDDEFFARYNAIRKYQEYFKRREVPSRDTIRKTEQIELLQRKIASLESENQRLRSELNTTKKNPRQERSFTLSMIVDYCKKKPDYEHVEQIEAMLYKFIRNGTDEEQALVDSIDEEFARRRCGNSFNGPVGQVIQHADKIEH